MSSHWRRCLSHDILSTRKNYIIIGSDNGLSPVRPQDIILTNADLSSIGSLETNFSEIRNKTRRFSFKEMYLQMPSAKWRSFCLGLDVLTQPVAIKQSTLRLLMMTSSNGNIFRVTGPLYGEFTGHRWIPFTKATDAELWCFLWSTVN